MAQVIEPDGMHRAEHDEAECREGPMGQSPGNAESRVKGIMDQPQSHQEENKRRGKGEEVVTA